MPDFYNRTVLDLGCGFGWHCNYAQENGAKRILGLDLSEKMLAEAKQRNAHECIEYQNQDIEHFSVHETFDCVISSLVFHYIQDFDRLVKKVHEVLNENGDFVFSVEHPIFTSAPLQQWRYKEDQKIDCWPIDDYFIEGNREVIFLNKKMTKVHRTLTTYIQTLLSNGFMLDAVIEPTPSNEMKEFMMDEFRRPMMLLVKAHKN